MKSLNRSLQTWAIGISGKRENERFGFSESPERGKPQN
jgi:hypothetical protein